jgi:phosphopantothenate-cysteine ligase
MRILVTSGGTKVPIDRVRDITNMSNGTFGSRIAHAALDAGHDVMYLVAKHGKTPFSMNLNYGEATKLSRHRWEHDLNQWSDFWNWCEQHRDRYEEQRFRNFDDYSQLLEHNIQLGKPDVVILAAAVSDYTVTNYVGGKIRSTSMESAIGLVPLPKLISRVKKWHPGCFLVGFKLLVDSTEEELLAAAEKSIVDNHCEMVVANDLSDLQNNDHCLRILTADEELLTFRKSESEDPLYLARKVIERVEVCHGRFCSESPVA